MSISTRFLVVGLLLSATPALVSKHCTPLRSQDIGFLQSPNPISRECLLNETFPGFNTTVFYNSAVSPTLAVNPVDEKQMVAVWQQDRFSRGGGALDIAIARTSNRGNTWCLSTFPFQICNEGISARTTNPSISYSVDGKRVYLLAEPFNVKNDPNTLNQSQVVVSVSEDNGKNWSIPHPLNASARTVQEQLAGAAFFNTAITADTDLPENAYAAWTTVPDLSSTRGFAEYSRTTDGGKSWEAHRTLYDPALDTTIPGLSNGPQALLVASATLGEIQRIPKGDLVAIITRGYPAPGVTNEEYVDAAFPSAAGIADFALVRSTDNGLTWSTEATQIVNLNNPVTTAPNPIFTCGYTIGADNVISAGNGTNIRTGGFGSAVTAVNPLNGNLYVAWEDSRFNFPGNQLNQIALSTSRDGGLTWSEPVKVSRTPSNAPNPQAFTPSLAVNEKGQVGILYHDFRNSPAPCVEDDGSTSTLTNSWFALYKEVALGTGSLPQAGLTFEKEVGLSTPYIIENGVPTAGLNPQGQGGQGIITNADQEGLIAGKKCFYALYGQSANGPFTPSQQVIGDPTIAGGCDLEGCLSVNNNRRVTPFFSTIVPGK